MDKLDGKLDELDKVYCKFHELDKLDCKLDELDKLYCKFHELDKLRMSSMSWISLKVSWMSLISWTVS